MNDFTFVEHLAGASSPLVFARTACGFAALQLYESIKIAGFDPGAHVASVEMLGEDVERLESDSRVRIALTALVQALPFWRRSEQSPTAGTRIARQAVYTALIQYGQALASEAEWRLADSVYTSTAVDAELDGEIVIAAEARFLSGFACRMYSDWEGSQAAYGRAFELASAAGETCLAFRIQIGQANNVWVRGNLPEAQRRLEIITRRARELCPEVVPRAVLARAGVANAAGEYEMAVVLAHRALESSSEDVVRYQALTDLASFLVDYGLPSTAAEALHVVATTAPDRGVRSHALLNRLFLAVKTGERDIFDTLRSNLDTATLTPRQQAQYALARSQGHRKFGQLALAREALDQATAVANEFKLFQLSFEAEEEGRQIALATEAATIRGMHISSRVLPNGADTQKTVTTISARIRRVQRSVHEMASVVSGVRSGDVLSDL